ncbi:BON domain-containing protein [Marinomonas sp.]
MENTTAKIALGTLLITSSISAFASNDWQRESKDAWIDGKAEATLLLNTSLNSFDINTDVHDRKITLTGSVDNQTEKSLAEELVSELEGVKSVNNQLTVVGHKDEQTNGTMQSLTDAKITTIVKTRLLMNSGVSGSDINVDTNKQTVTLKGQVTSHAEHDLALTIAKNTSDVDRVIDQLHIQ